MIAEIISVGSEILLGKITDTNSKDLARYLNELGIDVYRMQTAGDNRKRLRETIELAFSRSDMVIISGGLGPTEDDVTRYAVADFLGAELEENAESLERLKSYFKRRKSDFTQNNLKQACFPKNAEILPNDIGTADGFIAKKDGKYLIVLPGPPQEVNNLFKTRVMPMLKEKLTKAVFAVKALDIYGISEARMDYLISDIEKNASGVGIGTYAKPDRLEIRLVAKAQSESAALDILDPVFKAVLERMGENCYAVGEDVALVDTVFRYLIKNSLTISTAESCTGGLLAGKMVDFAGASEIFKSGFVTYSNEAKVKNLGVNPQTLDKYGAVSSQTAEEMAAGAANAAGSRIGISTTGIAGPTGGSDEKPVGLVYVGLSIDGRLSSKELDLGGGRANIRRRAVLNALDFLRRSLKIPIEII